MAYITVSNANRIIKKSELLSTDFKGEVYKLPIRFFSKYEANSLLAIQEFLKNPEHYFNEYYAPLRVSDSYNFIYEGHKPAYHDSLDCPRIYADYENFEIPKSIRKQGGESIFKFRAWFKNNDHLLSTKADLFYQKLKFSWGITERINQVKVANSWKN